MASKFLEFYTSNPKNCHAMIIHPVMTDDYTTQTQMDATVHALGMPMDYYIISIQITWATVFV